MDKPGSWFLRKCNIGRNWVKKLRNFETWWIGRPFYFSFSISFSALYFVQTAKIWFKYCRVISFASINSNLSAINDVKIFHHFLSFFIRIHDHWKNEKNELKTKSWSSSILLWMWSFMWSALILAWILLHIKTKFENNTKTKLRKNLAT